MASGKVERTEYSYSKAKEKNMTAIDYKFATNLYRNASFGDFRVDMAVYAMSLGINPEVIEEIFENLPEEISIKVWNQFKDFLEDYTKVLEDTKTRGYSNKLKKFVEEIK